MGATIIFSLLSVIVICWAKPDGAPNSACTTLTPVHGDIQAQRSDPPYTVSAIKSGNKVKVTISSPHGEEFEGFVVQARSSRDRSRLVDGTFTLSQVTKTINCSNGKQNTLTHLNPSSKTEVISEWTPSSYVNEDLVFRATVAKTYSLFWTQIDSIPIRIQSSGLSYTERPESTRMNENPNSMYDGCAITMGCFGLPAGCINRGDCEVLLSFSNVTNGISFKMQGYIEPRNYMAFGLSLDDIMGDDAVIECYRDDSRVYARTSVNVPGRKSNGGTRDLPRSDYDGSYNNGLTTCSWTAPFLTEANGRTYDMAGNEYYALLAKGPMRNGNLAYHDSRIASADRINFAAVQAVEDSSTTASVKIHGETEENTSLHYSAPTVHFTHASTEAKSARRSTAEASEETVDKHDKMTDATSDSLQMEFKYLVWILICAIIHYLSFGLIDLP